MSRPGFLNKVHGQSIFRGQQVYLLSWLCFVKCLLLPYFLPSFYIVVINVFTEREKLCHGPTFGDSLEKSEIDSKGRSFFGDYYILGQKLDKTGTDSKRRFFFRDHYVFETKN